MFRPKTVSAHCAETSVSAIVEVPKRETSVSAIVEVRSECAETSVSAILCRNIRPDLRIIYNFGIICITCVLVALLVIPLRVI